MGKYIVDSSGSERDQWQAFMNTVLKFRYHKMWGIPPLSGQSLQHFICFFPFNVCILPYMFHPSRLEKVSQF
jgi:hypothetical protein